MRVFKNAGCPLVHVLVCVPWNPMCADFNRQSGCPQHSSNLSLSLFESLTNTLTDRHEYTVLVGHQLQQKVYKHGFSPPITLERMGTYLWSRMTKTAADGWTQTMQNTPSESFVSPAVFVTRMMWKRTHELIFVFAGGHLLSQDFLPLMKPEICRGSWPSVATAISSWPRDNQNSSRLFKSVSTSAKSGSCGHRWKQFALSNIWVWKWVKIQQDAFVDKFPFQYMDWNCQNRLKHLPDSVLAEYKIKSGDTAST